MADALRRFITGRGLHAAPPGAVLRMAMSVPSALEAPKTEIVYRAASASDDAALKLTNARRRVLEQLKDGPAMAAAELAHLAGVGTSVIRPWRRSAARRRRAHGAALLRAAGRQTAGPELSPEQAVAAQGWSTRYWCTPFPRRWRRRARRRQDRGLFRGHCRPLSPRAGRCVLLPRSR